jgi:proteasome regulatory subunit
MSTISEKRADFTAERGLTYEDSYVKSVEKQLKYLSHENKQYKVELTKLQMQLGEIKREIERISEPPLTTAIVEDILADGRLVVKSSSGPSFVVNVSERIETKNVFPGSRVGLSQRTLAAVEVLPSSRDAFVSSMEVVTKPEQGYESIGGLEEQINEMREIIELPLKNPELFSKIGIEPPSGVLLYGPPGNGKTQLAKAVARETDSTFIRIVGSEFVKKYIGEGARIVREVFALAREKSPSILFIDEIDAIGARRTDTGVSGDREVERTMMQLLAEMDGFDPLGNIKIVAATNRPDILDPALMRPGRFDRIIEVPAPNRRGRFSILQIHSKNMSMRDIDLQALTDLTEGASGADLRAVCTEAGMFAIREGRDHVTMSDFIFAKCKVLGSYGDTETEQGRFVYF